MCNLSLVPRLLVGGEKKSLVFKVKVKVKVHLSDSPNMGIQNTTAKRKQHAHSDVIVKQYNIMSTQVVSGCHVRGETEIPESSSKLRHGHLRLDSIHTLRHHPETKTMFHWPLFLISLHIGRGCHTNKTTDTTPLHKLDELLIFQAQCSRQKL